MGFLNFLPKALAGAFDVFSTNKRNRKHDKRTQQEIADLKSFLEGLQGSESSSADRVLDLQNLMNESINPFEEAMASAEEDEKRNILNAMQGYADDQSLWLSDPEAALAQLKDRYNKSLESERDMQDAQKLRSNINSAAAVHGSAKADDVSRSKAIRDLYREKISNFAEGLDRKKLEALEALSGKYALEKDLKSIKPSLNIAQISRNFAPQFEREGRENQMLQQRRIDAKEMSNIQQGANNQSYNLSSDSHSNLMNNLWGGMRAYQDHSRDPYKDKVSLLLDSLLNRSQSNQNNRPRRERGFSPYGY